MSNFIELLSQMVREPQGIRVLVEQAGVPVEDVNWSGTSRAIWASVLQEERNAGTVGAILRVMLERYPENDQVWESGLEYINAVQRSRRQPTMSELATGSDHVAGLVEQLGVAINQRLDSLSQEVHGITRRLDDLESRLEARLVNAERTLQMVYIATPFKRSAWLMGFLLFILPMPLFIKEVRDMAGVHVNSVLFIAFSVWAIALVMFLYGLGFIREAR